MVYFKMYGDLHKVTEHTIHLKVDDPKFQRFIARCVNGDYFP